jgi:pimeloyl-ACP methyl ester carboxylesterase
VALLSYQHGTLVLTNDVPSIMNEQIMPGVGFASIGYAVAMPDLLGLGDSPGLHPYHHARSEATAGVDLLRAVRAWCHTNEVALNPQLFLIGYSQGGHATMALHREIESFHGDEFVVTASAPMAGAHDLSGTTADDLLSGRLMPNPYYLVYLLAAYQQVYHLTNHVADLLAAPYSTTLPPLMNGATPSDIINAAMPPDVRLVLNPEVLAAFQSQPEHPLRVALRDNDLFNWTPTAPTRLYHCRGDQDVIFANSEIAVASFQSRGALDVQLIDPDPTADHGGCALPAFLLAREWFETFRQ